MKEMAFSREKLLETVKTNRSKHREIFLEALEGYKKAMIAHLEQMLEYVRAGKMVEHHIRLVQPVDQTRDYDRAVAMLEMTVDDVVHLDEETFANLVLDDWSWSGQFIASNSTYSEKARNFRK